MFRSSYAAVMLATALVCGTASADVLLVDRGLPTANLNNAAGADRSNVSWTEAGGSSAGYWVDGDTFTNTSAQNWLITTIRMWSVEPNISSATLWGGLDGSKITVASAAGAITNATYVNGTTYQGYSGNYYPIQQIDFAVNINLAAGQTYDFFLTGTGGDYLAPFSHASNAAKSGSPQDGSDGSMLWASVDDTGLVVGGPYTSLGNGWDKVSDINVQVFGNAVPEPTSLALCGLALLGLAVTRRRKV